MKYLNTDYRDHQAIYSPTMAAFMFSAVGIAIVFAYRVHSWTAFSQKYYLLRHKHALK